MQKIYKNKSARNTLSKVVMEKLNHFESMRPKIEDKPEKQQPKTTQGIWDEENDLRLLNAVFKLYPDGPRHVKSSVWQQVAENHMPENKSIEQCKFRYNR
jgi:Myb-like DNA-binding domain